MEENKQSEQMSNGTIKNNLATELLSLISGIEIEDPTSNSSKSNQSNYLQDVYDFDNTLHALNTHAGIKRDVIDLLANDMENEKYSSQKDEEIDLKLLASPNFQAYKYSRKELIEFIILIFEDLEISEIPTDTLRNFLQKVCMHYKRVPYHNFTHAFSLTHFAYWMIKNMNSEAFFTKDDVIGILLSCIGHDLNHPGMNNGFMVKTQDPLAVLYNDQSVLENMHTSFLFEILQSDGYNVLKDFSAERRRHIREIIIEAVLSTDMSKHFKI